MTIAEQFLREQEAVRAACASAGRDPDEVTLLAVSKTVGVEGAREAFNAGARAFGENRPDELMVKAEALPDAQWHFIGNIQSRRISDIVRYATLIHSLTEIRHAEKISRVAQDLGKVQDVLVEVNVSGEESKSGVAPNDVVASVNQVSQLPNVRVRGLMTMAPQGDPHVARACFDDLAGWANTVRAQLPSDKAAAFDQISAGMSEDWPEAVAAGSTIVRIGRAIFSEEFA